jgi:hypothetical protein
MPGQKRVFALDGPGIHPSSRSSFEEEGCRVKPGNDGPTDGIRATGRLTTMWKE